MDTLHAVQTVNTQVTNTKYHIAKRNFNQRIYVEYTPSSHIFPQNIQIPLIRINPCFADLRLLLQDPLFDQYRNGT